MSVRLEADKIVLSGNCTVEDAEPLLSMMQRNPDFPVDIAGATHLHAAVLQLLMAFGREPIGQTSDSFLNRWIVPLLPNGVAGIN